jgi:hypothetical protein
VLESGNERQGLIFNADADPALEATGIRFVGIEHEGCSQKSEPEASDFGNRRVFQRLANGRPLVQGDFRTVRVESEHVPGEPIFVTPLTMLKAAKKGMPALVSKVRATFIKIGELPNTATH